MRIARVSISNFRGIREGTLDLPHRAVLAGDNNTGKSTVLEAIDLVLGPERLSRRPVIDEHDFFASRYLDSEGSPVQIRIDVLLVDLSEDQQRRFMAHLEWWDSTAKKLVEGPEAGAIDGSHISAALRVAFLGAYEPDEDDFVGETVFVHPDQEGGERELFRTKDKRECGFLFLRTLRTGSRALSLERGSLLDIILRLKNQRTPMWEGVLAQLRELSVAAEPELGLQPLLDDVTSATRRLVPGEWGDAPHLRVTDLTREMLRRTLTVFMGTGSAEAGAAPFQHQGTGTTNMLVLALLSIIAELKQTVIFAMEEPEIAIPPYAQKQVVSTVREKSTQALFTSHSPYVLEEFDPQEVLVLRRVHGVLSAVPAGLPTVVKPKQYREEFRKRFWEAVLARRVLVVEGRTEYDAYAAAARRLARLHPEEFMSLDQLGIAVVDAATDTQVGPISAHFRGLGKTVFAIYDKQPTQETSTAIESQAEHAFESAHSNFEDVLLGGTAPAALCCVAVPRAVGVAA